MRDDLEPIRLDLIRACEALLPTLRGHLNTHSTPQLVKLYADLLMDQMELRQW